MLAEPRHWQPFYPGDPVAAARSRRYSRSDRSRYYWPVPEVAAAVDEMQQNLAGTGVPDELVSQFLPWLAASEVPGAEQGRLTPDAVLRAAVRRVLDVYRSAT
jgi:D-tagatose-1,6-bisphosphate aldolase subunit GatZ/KbaZ